MQREDQRARRGYRRHLSAGAALFLLAAGLLPPTPGAAQPNREALRAAEHEAASRRAEAAEAARRAAALAERRIAAAARAQAADRVLDEALGRSAEAEAALAEARGVLDARARALSAVLPLARRLAQWPEEIVLAQPIPPEEALRGLIALRHVGRRIESEMVPLRAAAAAAEAAAHRAAAEAEALAAAQRSATDAAAAVEAELAAARAAVTAAEAAEREAATRAAAIAADATTLPQMLARVEATSRAATLRETADRRAGQGGPGAPALPVAGRIIRAFGAPEPGGPARGVTFAAPPGAQVVSPCAGRAAFAAPFRSYGLLLIVDCGGGYHVVLAGMADLAVPAGQRLLPGDPVGRLGAPEGGGGGRANLYVEVRRDGRPVDPRPFLAASG